MSSCDLQVFVVGTMLALKIALLIIIEDHIALPVISRSSVCPHLALIIPSFMRSVPIFLSLCCLKPSLLCIIIYLFIYSLTFDLQQVAV